MIKTHIEFCQAYRGHSCMKPTMSSCEPWCLHTHRGQGAKPGLGYRASVWAGREQARVCVGQGASPFPGAPPGGARGSFAVWPLAQPVAGRRGGKSRGPSRPPPRGPHAPAGSACREVEEDEGTKERPRASHQQVEGRGPAGLGATALSFWGEKACLSPASLPFPPPALGPFMIPACLRVWGLWGFLMYFGR